jgi:NADH-quinone oxidoreductase subunit F
MMGDSISGVKSIYFALVNSMENLDTSIVERIVSELGQKQQTLIPILRRIQKHYNYLPQPALERLCQITDLHPVDVMGVATFYSQFRLKPAGKHTIKVCFGTACHVKGAENVYSGFKQYLDIKETEDTDKDRLFTIEKVACLGCCMLAPAVQIDEITYGHLSTETIPLILNDFLQSQQQADESVLPAKGKKQTLGAEIRICNCSSCQAAGAQKVLAEIKHQVGQLGINAKTKIVGCTGISFEAPLVEIVLSGAKPFRYGRVHPLMVNQILTAHFKAHNFGGQLKNKAGQLLDRLLTDELWQPVVRYRLDLENGADSLYWGCQKHVVTHGCGELDPLDIKAYLNDGGFAALKKCGKQLTPQAVIKEIEKSGLRGRGGGGFYTARKMHTLVKQRNKTRYIICNGDEGDPGAFMDRMILESFPFKVIEGMAIAAYAVQANEGFIYVRAEYPLAINRVKQALAICKNMNLLPHINLQIVEGAGAFVCGEETALIAAIEGRRGNPRLRPPYPTSQGLWGKPTMVNNVETFSILPWIILHGAEEFTRLGTNNSKGTKTFALAGRVKRGGLIEVPMGITIREIVEQIGGGIQDDRKFKAVQIGGPSGGCVPASLADTPIDFEALQAAGAIMGSGGLVVLDESDCMVDIARYFMSFTQFESCGKCTFCRVGTKQMLNILENLCNGTAGKNDIQELEQLALMVKQNSLCGLGRTAPNPVLSTLKYFQDEYQAHLQKRCPALKCRNLLRYTITDKCIGCTRCAQHCPVGAIQMRPYQQHEIDQEKCTKCGTCKSVCAADAVTVKSLGDA